MEPDALALAFVSASDETRSTCCAFLEAHLQELEARRDREVSLRARWDSAMAACALISRTPTTDVELVSSTHAAMSELLEELAHGGELPRDDRPNTLVGASGGPGGEAGELPRDDRPNA